MSKTIIIVPNCRCDPETGEPVEIASYISHEGWSDGRMGIIRDRRVWVLVHLPSGFLIHPALRSVEDARYLATVLGPLLPADGELGQSPAARMSAERRERLRATFREWLDERGYKHQGLVKMIGEPAVVEA